MEILATIIILIAPIVQIIWSIRRVQDKARMSTAGIAILMSVLSMALTLAVAYFITPYIPQSTSYSSCAGPGITFLILGGVVSVVGIPIIGLAFLVLYYYKHSGAGEAEGIAKIDAVLRKHYK